MAVPAIFVLPIFIAAEISHGAIGKKRSPHFSPAVARQNIEIPRDLVAGVHAPEGHAQRIINLNN